MQPTSEINVFVDESGSFAPDGVDACSPHYLLCLVFHDQSSDISNAVSSLEASLSSMGLAREFSLHAGPLVRREEAFALMPREFRIGLFRRMMVFMQKADFRYRCFDVFKPYSTKRDAIHDVLLQELIGFLVSKRESFNSCAQIKVYYDNGQAQVTALLKEAFLIFSSKTQFVPAVQPSRYRLFQAADFICTLELIRAKLEVGGALTHSEERFFGGIRNLKKLYLKPILRKRWL